MADNILPRILVIDDLYGRVVSSVEHADRKKMCKKFGLCDVTDEKNPGSVTNPIAKAVFHRGQKPEEAKTGQMVRNDLEGTIKFIRESWENSERRWALVVLDLEFLEGLATEESKESPLGMPDRTSEFSSGNIGKNCFGLQLGRAIKENFPELPFVFLSSHKRDKISLDIDKVGPIDHLQRENDHLQRKNVNKKKLKEYIEEYGLMPDETGKMVGNSLALLKMLREIRQAIRNPDSHILIRGEQGTGKRLVAEYIHGQTAKRKDKKFLSINCPGLSTNLWQNEIMGQDEIGGGIHKRSGLLQTANGGDLFLDEIADLKPDVQAGLLGVLQDGEFREVGSSEITEIDVRAISATNKNIEDGEVKDFQRDLLDRLTQGGIITVPPLRDRLDDLELLVQHCVKESESKVKDAFSGREIMPCAVEKLQDHSWPGNIRILQEVIESAVKKAPFAKHLLADHISFKDDKPTSGAVGDLPPSPSECIEESKHDDSSSKTIDDALNSIDFESMSSDDLKGLIPAMKKDEIRRRACYLAAIIKELTKNNRKFVSKATYLYMVGYDGPNTDEAIKAYHATTPGLESYNDHTPTDVLRGIVDAIEETDEQLFERLPELQQVRKKKEPVDKSGNDKESTDPACR